MDQKTGPAFKGVIDAEKIIEFAEALGLANPVHRDERAAKEAGYRGVLAPPGFVTSNLIQSKRTKLEAFGISEDGALLGEMSFDQAQLICGGDEISGQSVLVDTYKKEGRRPMTAFVIETGFRNQAGETVLTVRETAFQLHGDPG